MNPKNLLLNQIQEHHFDVNMTQTQAIYEYLKQGNSLTPLDALSLFGCMRLEARIWELKQQGIDIQMDMIKHNDKHFARYFMTKKEKQLVIPI